MLINEENGIVNKLKKVIDKKEFSRIETLQMAKIKASNNLPLVILKQKSTIVLSFRPTLNKIGRNL